MSRDALKSLFNQSSVDIEHFPPIERDYKYDNGAQLTLGDLHGNALKLLYTLVRHGVLTQVSPEDYANFVRLYNKNTDDLSAADLRWFNHFIIKAKVNPNGTLRLIGDDLADRGANDYFTLKILQKLFNRTNVEILISNHTLEFVHAYERANPYISPNLMFGQAASMERMNILIQKGLLRRQEIDALFAHQYLPNLKLLSYTLDETNNRLAIFSHAPIGIESVQYIAQKLGVTYKDNTMVELAQTIENINTVFTNEYVNKKRVHTLFADGDNLAGPENADPKVAPFTHLIWNRNHSVNRPENYKGYKLKFIHGHDYRETTLAHRIYNLDNHLGKGTPRGPYHVHFTHEKQLRTRAFAQHTQEDQAPELIEENANFLSKALGTLKDIFVAPSRHPVITTLIATAVVGLSAFALAASVSTMAASSLIMAFTSAGLIKLRNNLAKNAQIEYTPQNIARHSQQVQRAFHQGQEAAKGWVPYAKTFSLMDLTSWRNQTAFKAGMEHEMERLKMH
ncbi:MAG: hypothetical protein JSR17_03210 [Proteobacteria bacterium]|nr:hypothetical protein [Pseudomonadota bacterium]